MKCLSRLNNVIQRIIILLRQVATHESDTTALLRNLSTSDNHIDSVLRTLSHVRGPWAFVYYQVSINRTNCNYFGIVKPSCINIAS